jgi:casein kinase I family protein HRR25
MDLRIGNNYRIGRKIGSGSFGEIYLGKLLLLFFRFAVEFARVLAILKQPLDFEMSKLP